MGFINVDLKQVTSDLMFSPLRTLLNLDWTKVIFTPFKNMISQLESIRLNNLFLTNHTSQKISLEHLFNNLLDDNGNKLIVGSPVTCETDSATPLFYFFTDSEREIGSVPQGIVGTYNYNGLPVQYNPTLAVSWTDAEIYDANYNVILPPEQLTWRFTEEDVVTNQYTIYVDPIDYVGYNGLDQDGNVKYIPGSKLDIIDKYAAQYTVTGVMYNIEFR